MLFAPFVAAAGGQGGPDGLVAGLACDLPASLPEVVDDGPGFDEPELDPEFGFEALGDPGVPGNVPHGDPLGVVPGSFRVFGFTVDGCVLLPGAGLPGEFEPGTVPGVVFLGVAPLVELEPGVFGFCGACGVAVLARGVAVPAGGVAVLAGGVAVLGGGVAVPGVEL